MQLVDWHNRMMVNVHLLLIACGSLCFLKGRECCLLDLQVDLKSAREIRASDNAGLRGAFREFAKQQRPYPSSWRQGWTGRALKGITCALRQPFCSCTLRAIYLIALDQPISACPP